MEPERPPHVIDLDQGAARPARPHGDHRRRWRRTAIAGALVLAGALLGSSVTYREVVARHQEQRDSTVSALVLATRNPAAGDVPSRVPGARRTASVTTDVQVTIVNTGLVAINVPSLSTTQAGVALSITDKARWIAPGTSVAADAVVTVKCEVGYPLGDLEATVSVLDGDRSRLSPVSFPAGPWNDQLEACRGKRAASVR